MDEDELTWEYELAVKRKKYCKILYICIGLMIFCYIASNYIIIHERTAGTKSTSSLEAGIKVKGRITINKGPMYDVTINHTGTLIAGKITICYVKKLEDTMNISELSKENIIETVIIDEPGDYDITTKLGDLPDSSIYRYMEVSKDFEGSSITVRRYVKRTLMDIITNIIINNIF